MRALLMLSLLTAGCIGPGGAVSVRWRIVERETGARFDPDDVDDGNGVCCQQRDAQLGCTGQPGWHVNRVALEFRDPVTSELVPDLPMGLDAPCSARELTTPFELDEGSFAIQVRAFDPSEPAVAQALSPSPELRDVKRGEIVNLDIVELSVSAAAD
jgi:hypothetical protein